ncbi:MULTISPECIES: amino acid ABC transporter permease [unclassified Butyrivibrio]|jgi:L-cystine transport system permease protein|uniref:amino acid ABC transporter permease n=1 Tax=unclassified Butyrivibrio TaxID=2639466 RepID=UPI00047C4F0A|nr:MULTISPECIES: amino acid ABC transporter permease [unclassified Butyrivibrio]
MGNYFSIDRFINVFPKIISNISVNFHIVFWSMLFGTILAVLVAVLRLKKIPVISQIISVYISFMRGTPLLVQMMIAFYGIPLLLGSLFLNVFGINLNRIEPVIFVEIAIILNEGAFLGEIFRGAITSVPSIQTEAGYSIGMTGAQTFSRIVLPQAFKVALPHYGVDLVGVFQNTSLVFTLGVVDVLGKAKTLGAATGHTLEGYIAATLVYITFSLILKGAFLLLEKKLK